jgi:putative Mg2+ transporter-C (MgtC) family protein
MYIEAVFVMDIITIILKLLLAILIGGIIGAEREYQNKSAGLRTMMLISLGSALFTIISMDIDNTTSPDRIASNIVTGIGFVGAGVIFKGDTGVNGITTAATIWVTAALGMGIGAGYEWASVAGCVLLLPILYGFTYIEKWLDRANRSHNYKIVCTYTPDIIAYFEKQFKIHRLKPAAVIFRREGETFSGTWTVSGPEKSHRKLIKEILDDPAVKSFEF